MLSNIFIAIMFIFTVEYYTMEDLVKDQRGY
jgi:hypothetical protein